MLPPDFEIEYCRKCDTLYLGKMSDFFYFETRSGNWRKPCKKCLSDYNKTPAARATRYAVNRRYKQTEKGKLAERNAKIRLIIKKWRQEYDRRTKSIDVRC